MTTTERTVEPQDHDPDDEDSYDFGQQDGASGDQTNVDTWAGQNDGIQNGQVNGDVTQNNWYNTPEPELAVDRLLSEEMWQRATHHWAECDGFDKARGTLLRRRLVFLRSEGTGRSFTATRLLIHCGVKRIAHLNERKAPDRLQTDGLLPQQGYLWAGLDRASQSGITSHAAERLAEYAQQADAYIVVVVDDNVLLSHGLEKFEESLHPPDPVEVAVHTLLAKHDLSKAEAEAVLGDDFREHLPPGTAPNVAEDAAYKAWDVHNGERDRADALKDVSRDLREAVAEWFRSDRSTIEYAMLVALSVFEDRDYHEVVASAEKLERMIAKVDLPEDETITPRKIFDFSKTDLLRRLRAGITRHRHADELDLYLETAHFVRSAWAQEALRRMWSEYDLLRPVVVEWMAKQSTGRSRWYCAKALHDVTVNVPSSDPLEPVYKLAGSQLRSANFLAVELLSRLAEDPGTRSAVERSLRRWCGRKQEYHRKWTATRVYATHYGRCHPEMALTQLEKIARENGKLQDEVKAAVLALLDRPDNRTLVLGKLREWTHPFPLGNEDETANLRLRAVGLDCAQAALGLLPDTRYLRSLPPKTAGEPSGDPDTSLVAALFRRVFLDKRTASNALRTLLDFGDYCATRPDGDAAKGLVQLLDTVAPRLHDRADHLLFHTWSEDFPERSHRIHRLFGIVQRLQYQHS